LPAAQPPAPAEPAPAEPAPPTPPPSPPPPAEAIEDTGSPRAQSPEPLHPAGGLGLEIGYARGGDRFLTVLAPTPTGGGTGNGVDAGDGAFFSLAGNWTPYWSERGIGLGVYARAGVKFVAVQDGTTVASFLRCPLAAGAQVLLPIAERWFALGRLGLITEVLEQVTAASGGMTLTTGDFSPTLGEFVDAGVFWTPWDHTGFAAIARYERLTVSYAGDDVNASNLGALFAGYVRF
jgi:hypothetical protein